MYAVVVNFTIHPESTAAFMPKMYENARLSLSDEPGCLQFDVCHNADVPTEVFLYEIYKDRAAFDAHLASPHFKAFDAATTDMIANKVASTYDQVTQ